MHFSSLLQGAVVALLAQNTLAQADIPCNANEPSLVKLKQNVRDIHPFCVFWRSHVDKPTQFSPLAQMSLDEIIRACTCISLTPYKLSPGSSLAQTSPKQAQDQELQKLKNVWKNPIIWCRYWRKFTTTPRITPFINFGVPQMNDLCERLIVVSRASTTAATTTTTDAAATPTVSNTDVTGSGDTEIDTQDTVSADPWQAGPGVSFVTDSDGSQVVDMAPQRGGESSQTFNPTSYIEQQIDNLVQGTAYTLSLNDDYQCIQFGCSIEYAFFNTNGDTDPLIPAVYQDSKAADGPRDVNTQAHNDIAFTWDSTETSAVLRFSITTDQTTDPGNTNTDPIDLGHLNVKAIVINTA